MSHQYPKIDIFQQGDDGMPYLLVYLHQKQLSKIGLETRPKINLWGLGLMTLLIILIVHSNGERFPGSQFQAA